MCSQGSGLLVDFSVSCNNLSLDQAWCDRVYGKETSPAAVLRGGVVPPQAAAALSERLREGESQVAKAAFEPSCHSTAYW